MTRTEHLFSKLAEECAEVIERVIHDPTANDLLIALKKQKVEKFFAFSAARGLVDGVAPDPTFPHPEANG